MTDLPPPLGAIVSLPPRGRPHLAPWWVAYLLGFAGGLVWATTLALAAYQFLGP